MEVSLEIRHGFQLDVWQDVDAVHVPHVEAGQCHEAPYQHFLQLAAGPDRNLQGGPRGAWLGGGVQ